MSTDEGFKNMKERLTIIIGAGAVIDASGVSTNSITQQLLVSDKIRTSSRTLYSNIHSDLLELNAKWDIYVPNFEDIFHGLEILSSMFTKDNAAPEYKTIYKIFTNLKEKYDQYNPYKNDNKNDIKLSLAIEDLLANLTNTIKSYSDKEVAKWYKEFFMELNKKFSLDIFNLNYDTWFEKIFLKYNDGFVDSNQNSDYLSFSPSKAINLDNDININHLHGQIDFSYVNPKVAQNEFNDSEVYTIYKVKNPQKTKAQYHASSFQNTQEGEHLVNTTIITGKKKTEKIAFPPFDTYRANLQRCLIRNSNLLIIGYGFGDFYVNNVLQQFNKVHTENKRVNIISYANESDWNKGRWDKTQISNEQFKTMYGIFNDDSIGKILKSEFVPHITFNNGQNHLYLNGFKNTAENNLEQILQVYKRSIK